MGAPLAMSRSSIARRVRAKTKPVEPAFIPLQSVTYYGVSIALTPVASSNVGAIGHCAADHVLIVQFRSGAVYAYRHVKSSIHAALMAAPSKGRYLAQHIVSKALVFPCERLDLTSGSPVRASASSPSQSRDAIDRAHGAVPSRAAKGAQ